ncbi:MAG: diguanylate cyclase [Candidatus Competibacteraceae bacterium]|nr:diguanylate cyclase [Candidatus Competibacteraceae bacterium]
MFDALSVNTDYIYFIYGLSFLLLATRALALSGRDQTLPWRWLAAFGLLHGLNEWLDLLALSLGDAPVFKEVRLVVMIMSFLPLVEFGRRGLMRQGFKSLGGWIYLPLLALVGLGGWAGISGLNIAGRYALALPGGLLAGCTLWRAAATVEGERYLGLRWAAGSMLLYGLAAGLIVADADFPPASWLNYDRFFAATGIPIQLVRALGAIGVMTGIWLHGQQPKSKKGRFGGIVRWRYPVAFVVLVTLGWLATEWRGHSVEAEMRERLLRQAMEIAQALPVGEVEALSFTATDRGTPAFERIRELMIAYGRLVQQHSIYSMALRDGAIVFGPENLAEDDPWASPPGTVYRQPASENFEMFRTGQPVAFGPWQDEYGVFVSAVAPVRDLHSGKVLMVVGLDIRVSDWNHQALASRLVPILSTLLLLTLLLGGAGAIQWRNRQAASRRLHFRHFETALVGTLGLALTLAATLLVLEAENRERGVFFHRLADARAGNIREVFSDIRAALSALAQFYQASQQVNRAEFHAFVAPLAKATTVQAYEWIPHIPAADKARFEAEAQGEGSGDFIIWEHNAQGERVPVSGRADYYPVYGLEPRVGNEVALGFDLGSESIRRTALETALRTGLITATHPLTLVQETEHQSAILVFQPVFAPVLPMPENSNAGGDAGRLRGFVLGVLRLQTLLDRALLHGIHDSDEVAVDLIDLMIAAGPTLLAVHPHDYESRHIEAITVARFEQREFQAVHPLFTFGRAQAVLIRPTPLFHAAHPARAGWLTGLAGLLLTAVLATFVGFLRNRQAVLEQQVQTRTAALQESEEQFRSYYELGLIGMAITSPTKGWVQFNDRLCQILGYPRAELVAKTWAELTHPDDLAMDMSQFNRVLAGEIEGYKLDKRFVCQNGGIVDTVLSVRCVRDPAGSPRHFIVMVQDITERKALERELRRLATTDSLTELSNRRHFLAQMTQELVRFKRYARPVALLMFDLDHFKRVNDQHGHAAGDDVLRHFSAVARQMLRQVDLLGRLGGEEFAALLPGTDFDGAQQLAERLRRRVAESPVTTAGGVIRVTVSIGVTLFAMTDSAADAILGRADRALYRAKSQGRNRVEIELPP